MMKHCYFYDWIIKNVVECNKCVYSPKSEDSCQGYFGTKPAFLDNTKRFIWVYFENEIYISHYSITPRINDFINESNKGMNI